jgi:polygalacturonase
VKAADINDVAAEIVGTQKVLGAGAKGSQSTVEARLDQGIDSAGNPGGVRQTIGFASLDACIKNNTIAAVSGKIQGEPGHTESLNQIQFVLESDTEIKFPAGYKIDWTKTTAGVGVNVFQILNKTNIIIDGGEIDQNGSDTYGHEGDNLIYMRNCQNVTIRNMYLHDSAGNACVYIDGCEDVLIENCIMDMPRILTSKGYTCITIGAGSPSGSHDSKNIRVKNCQLTGGLHSVIDIEDATTEYEIDGVVIEGQHKFRCSFVWWKY